MNTGNDFHKIGNMKSFAINTFPSAQFCDWHLLTISLSSGPFRREDEAMNPTQPFRFSRAEKLVLLASALAGVGVPWAAIRPGGTPTAILLLLLACAAAAAGIALHLRERRRLRRDAVRPGAARAAGSAVRSGWVKVAPAT
jgi:hypothetical protein